MDNYTELIGLKINEIRKYKKMSQEDVALRGGLHQAQVGYIERNEKVPTISTLRKIAKGLDVDIAVLLDVETKYSEESLDESFVLEFNKYLVQLDDDEKLDALAVIKGMVRWKKKLQPFTKGIET